MKTHIFQDKLVDSLNRFKTNTAVEYGNQRITYEELDRRSNYIAHRLAAEGFQKESFVGILTRDIPRLITVIIGVLKAGCVFIPLDPAYPKKRLTEMIRSVDARLVIGDKDDIGYFTQNAADSAAVFADLDHWYPGENAADDVDSMWFEELPSVTCHPDDKIYIYFTSGSTGVPKAIVGRNKGLNHFIQWEIDTFAVDDTFRVSQFTNIGFDAFLRDVFVPLCAGGTVCIPNDRDLILNDRSLINWLDLSRINLVHAVPSFFKLVLHSDALEPHFFQDLRYVLLSGEKIEPADLTRWYRTFGDRIQLVNYYGPTETTMIKTYYLLREADLENETIPIGKPMRGTRVIILDNNMEICDELEVGELYIRTPYRSHGYYKDDPANRQRFIPNPFSDNPDDIIYKTGDLARSLPDGNIELIGRVDRQVKVRGIRVELEGIESALVKHPRVKETAVITNKTPGGNVSLIAFITRTGEVENLTDVVKNDLYDQLPEYMVPARIIQIEKMPRKPNFKVDYEKLTDILKNEIRDYVAPKTPIEEKLAGIWSQVLRMDKIGVTDNFFELGGDSLTIMPLVTKIHKEFNVKISLKDAFSNPTVKGQAEIVAGAAQDKYTAIEKAAEKDYYALSSAQKRLYFMQRMDPGSVAYNMIQGVVMEGSLDRDKLEKCFEKIIDRHESLRTSFRMVNEMPVQEIHETLSLPFAVDYYDPEEAGGIEEKVISDFVKPFDLSRPPLLRVGLIKREHGKHVLITDMHHIISDGFSLNVLVNEFVALYAGEELTPLPFQYKDYSEWRNSPSQLDAVRRQEEFWLKQFDTQPQEINLPYDYDRGTARKFVGKRVNFSVSRREAGALKALALNEGKTLYMVLLSIYYIFLAKISGREDITLGTVTTGRIHPDLQQVIGMFVNTLALRNYPSGEKSYSQFLADVAIRTIDAFENQDYPFEDLVEKVVVKRDTNRNPLFDVLFQFENVDTTQSEVRGLKVTPYEFQRSSSKFDLSLIGIEADKDLYFILEYSTELFREESVESFIDYFKDIVSSVLEDPKKKISDIQIGSQDDLLSQLNDDLEDE
jgi:amino acid adenylation domain-containing protein